MKLTELILELHTIMLEKGNLTVYTYDWDSVESPHIHVSEGGSENHPYPGVYLS